MTSAVETPIINRPGDLSTIDSATGDRQKIGHVEQVDAKWLAVPTANKKSRTFKTHEGACEYLCRLAWGL